MAGLCEGSNEPPDSLKARPRPTSRLLASRPHAEAEVDDHPTRIEVAPRDVKQLGHTEPDSFQLCHWKTRGWNIAADGTRCSGAHGYG
ncbi:hypothetical protein ANN_06344 [Periplaneta americana]|uniref:Uncharacterized protein n=1 Tax=Periplaneta americana TaxID=6978 RepID=A0ABQ8TDG5_PERAM|nr:hypothetical protein ANN_06344 [Periplaneta americana]